MAITAAMAAASAIPTAAQTGLGIYQAVKGFNLANQDRPQYSIPQEILDNLTDAEVQALRGMPAEQKQQFIDNIMRSQQASMQALADRKSGLSGIGTINQNAMDSYRKMLSMDAQQRQKNEQALISQRDVVADYRDKVFQQNEMNPFLEDMQAAEALKGSGFRNIMGGVSSGAKMGIDAMKYNQYMKGINNQPSVDTGIYSNLGGSKMGYDEDYEMAVNKAYQKRPKINL